MAKVTSKAYSSAGVGQSENLQHRLDGVDAGFELERKSLQASSLTQGTFITHQRHLRELFEIDSAEYMLSICGDRALRELSSPRKSGSVFYLSNDDRYMIKTMHKAEVKALLGMISNYYDHVCTFENTLVAKFFGLHRIKPADSQKVRFIVMGSIFCTELRIHRKFDLKGSSQGRSADKLEMDENTALKDLDLDFAFRLEPSWRQTLLRESGMAAVMVVLATVLMSVHFNYNQWATSKRIR